jgi:hypothetical protein
VTMDVDFEMITVGLTLVTVNRVFVDFTVTRCGVTVRVREMVVDLKSLRKHRDLYVRTICLRFGYC